MLAVVASAPSLHSGEPVAHSFRFPVTGEWVASRGFAESFVQSWCGFHLADDIPRRSGTPVYPAAVGTVRFADTITASTGNCCGYVILIEHLQPNGAHVTSVYYHLRRPQDGGIGWAPGEEVDPDEALGYVSGRYEDHGSLPHLHFGIRDGKYETGIDDRTERWFYPGYTTIRHDGVRQCDATDPVHGEIVGEWVNPEAFIETHQGGVVTGTTPSLCSRRDGIDLVSLVWLNDQTGADAVYLNRYDSSGGRLLAEDVQVSLGVAAASEPSCAVDGTGDTHVVWLESGAVMYAEVSPSGMLLTGPQVQVGAAVTQPHLDVEPNGNVHLAWIDTTGNGKYLELASGCATQTLQDAPSGPISAEHLFVLAPGWGNDYAFLSWHGFDSPSHPFTNYTNLTLAYPNCNGLLGPFQETNDIAVSRTAMTEIGAPTNGAFLVFDAFDPVPFGFAGVPPQHVYWLLNAGLYRRIDQGAGPAGKPGVAALGAGEIVLAFEDSRFGVPGIYCQGWDGVAGQPIGNNCLVSGPGAEGTNPSIARAGMDKFAIAWEEGGQIRFAIRDLACPGPGPVVLYGPVTNPANEHEYYLLEPATWTDSEAAAVTLGGHLVTVNDAAEENWIFNTFAFFGGLNRSLWIGLSDADSEGTFTWVNGEPATFTQWSAGEPNAGPGENYVHIYAPEDLNPNFWNDTQDLPGGACIPSCPWWAFDGTWNGVVEVVP